MIYILADLIVAGGVALYINRSLQSKPLPLLSKSILNCAEIICTEIIIPNGKT